MGSSQTRSSQITLVSITRSSVMAPKAMSKAGAALSKGALAEKVAGEAGLKRAQAVKILDNIAAIGTAEVKKAGKFVVPGLVMIKTKKKPATKAGKKMMFGKEVVVKAKPAKTVVKAFPVAALKKSI